MTDAELERIAALASAATPGEWVYSRGNYGSGYVARGSAVDEYGEVAACHHENGRANAAFIAASRDAVPALLAMVADLTAQRDHARAWAAWHAGERHGERPAEPLAGDLWCGFCGEFHERR